jgi:putative Holliday junction resolvase
MGLSNRVLGVDVGSRRVGLAISDPSRTLARPLTTLSVRSEGDAVEQVTTMIASLADEPDGLGAVVIGLPTGLDGRPNDATRRVNRFVVSVRTQSAVPVYTEDERLSSREAESRLAIRERDWRRRKERLDAAAAAVVLQDYLDRSR